MSRAGLISLGGILALAGTLSAQTTRSFEVASVKAGAPGDPNDGPAFLTALREQLGFRLESTRGAVDVFVIDRVERPTPD